MCVKVSVNLSLKFKLNKVGCVIEDCDGTYDDDQLRDNLPYSLYSKLLSLPNSGLISNNNNTVLKTVQTTLLPGATSPFESSISLNEKNKPSSLSFSSENSSKLPPRPLQVNQKDENPSTPVNYLRELSNLGFSPSKQPANEISFDIPSRASSSSSHSSASQHLPPLPPPPIPTFLVFIIFRDLNSFSVSTNVQMSVHDLKVEVVEKLRKENAPGCRASMAIKDSSNSTSKNDEKPLLLPNSANDIELLYHDFVLLHGKTVDDYKIEANSFVFCRFTSRFINSNQNGPAGDDKLSKSIFSIPVLFILFFFFLFTLFTLFFFFFYFKISEMDKLEEETSSSSNEGWKLGIGKKKKKKSKKGDKDDDDEEEKTDEKSKLQKRKENAVGVMVGEDHISYKMMRYFILYYLFFMNFSFLFLKVCSTWNPCKCW
jgi:hypothetical protein